jgi:hypothetical protein
MGATRFSNPPRLQPRRLHSGFSRRMVESVAAARLVLPHGTVCSAGRHTRRAPVLADIPIPKRYALLRQDSICRSMHPCPLSCVECRSSPSTRIPAVAIHPRFAAKAIIPAALPNTAIVCLGIHSQQDRTIRRPRNSDRGNRDPNLRQRRLLGHIVSASTMAAPG